MRAKWTWTLVPVLSAAIVVGLYIWSPWSEAASSLTLSEAENKLLKQYAGKIESSRQDGERYELRLRTDAGLYAIRLSAADGQVESIERLEAAKTPPPEIVSREEVKKRLEGLDGFRVERLELDTSEGGVTRLYVAEVIASSGERRRLEIDAYTGQVLTNRAAKPQGSGGGTTDDGQGNGGTAGGVPGGNGSAGTPNGNAGQTEARLLSEEEAKAAAAAALKVEASAVEDSDAELRSKEDGQAYYLVDVELKNGREAEVQINAVSGAMQTITWDEEEKDQGSDDTERGRRHKD